MRNEPEVIPEGMCSDVDLEVPSLSDFLLLVSADSCCMSSRVIL